MDNRDFQQLNENTQKTQPLTTWSEISKLLKDGISLIPVRDKEQNSRPAKTPYSNWKEFQTRIATEGELWHDLEKYNTSAIAAVCGEVSGWLECIDIDSKYKAGIDAVLFADINKIYPDIFNKLRIHKTPSGGYHILYRIEDHEVEGNQKLASYKGENNKTITFLETRGEGGYILMPPSMGYTVHQDNPIPQITWEERCSLINLCRSYNEVIKVAPSPEPTKTESTWYSTNPFEDFNQRSNPTELMESHGWKFLRENNSFIWYTRPGKTEGVSASFNLEKRVFYIFTSSTDLESNTGYNPATLYAKFHHNGDKRAAYKNLVDDGYGKLKQNVEMKLAKELAIQGKRPLKSFSENGIKEHERITKEFADNYPYGIFWKVNKEGKPEISYSKFLYVAQCLGYRQYRNELVQINGRFIESVETRELIDSMLSYIQGDDQENIDLLDAFEKFIQTSIKNILSNRIMPLEEEKVISDSANVCYKFFENCIVEITAFEKTLFKTYDEIEGLIFANKVIPRKYDPKDATNNLFEQYLINSTDPARIMVSEYIKNILGWLCHDYNSPANIYIIIMTEMVIDPKDGGGSGKNILANMLSRLIGMSIASGSMVKWDDKFFSVWKPSTRLLFVPDLPKQVDWPFLKNAVENPLINKKYEKEYSVSTEEAPKLLFNTNYSFDDVDGGLKRRIRTIEFTDYYTVRGGVDRVHGKLFPHDWSDEEWNGFIGFMINCIQMNLDNKGKIEQQELSHDGKIKKFISNHGERYYEFFNEYIDHWCEKRFVSTANFNENLHSFFTGEKTVSGTKLNVMLDEFCVLKDIFFNKNSKTQGERVREFYKDKNIGHNNFPF